MRKFLIKYNIKIRINILKMCLYENKCGAVAQ